jgi:hypothetical protein
MAPISTSREFSRGEVGLALRNPGMQLEGLRRRLEKRAALIELQLAGTVQPHRAAT